MKLILKDEVGICGVNKQKGLFIDYKSYEYGTISLEFYKSSNDGKYYYLIDNPNFSSYATGKVHDDILIIHSKVEKLINLILENKELELLELRNLSHKLFGRYKKYQYDSLDLKDIYDTIRENKKGILEYIENNINVKQ